MRAMLCWCGQRLEAGSNGALAGEVVLHYRREHTMAVAEGESIRQIVKDNSYGLEYAVVYPNGEGPDEEFGLEPY